HLRGRGGSVYDRGCPEGRGPRRRGLWWGRSRRGDGWRPRRGDGWRLPQRGDWRWRSRRGDGWRLPQRGDWRWRSRRDDRWRLSWPDDGWRLPRWVRRASQLRVPARICASLQSVRVRSLQSVPSSPLRLRGGAIRRRRWSLWWLVLELAADTVGLAASLGLRLRLW